MTIPFVNLRAQYQGIAKEINDKITGLMANGDFILGEELKLFEEEFSAYCGTRYAIGVASGTDALTLSLLACGINRGDEVIAAANTFAATVEAIYQAGAKPVLIDIDEGNYNLDLNQLEKTITEKTKAVIPVHLYGQTVDMDKLKEIADERQLLIIEDAAQAHGAKYKNKKAGSFGKAGCFSFYPAKNLGAYGDAGAIVTDDKEIAEKIKILRNHGQREKYLHEIVGFNSRLDNLQAAVLRIKLRYLDGWNKARNESAQIYNESLKGTSLITPKIEPWAEHVFHLYVVRCKKRDELRAFLKERGIDTGIHYPIPIHLLEAFKNLGYKKGDFPVAERTAEEIVSLPMFPELTKEDINYVAGAVREFEKLFL